MEIFFIGIGITLGIYKLIIYSYRLLRQSILSRFTQDLADQKTNDEISSDYCKSFLRFPGIFLAAKKITAASNRPDLCAKLEQDVKNLDKTCVQTAHDLDYE
jgi:hypothetical protein